jgi:hypothetical protein
MHKFDLGPRKSVRIQPIGIEALVSRSDANSRRVDASLIQVVSQGIFVSTSPLPNELSTSEIYYNKLILVTAKLTRSRNQTHRYASCLMRIK